jgi:hypothetical protein
MIKLLPSILAFIFFACDKKIAKEQPASKKIKSILESFHEPINRTGKFEHVAKIADGTYMYSSLFSREGLLMQKNTFNSSANLETKTEYKYDDKGNNIEISVYNSKGSLIGKTINTFDASNKLIEDNSSLGGKIISKQTSVIDLEGNSKRSFYELKAGVFVISSQKLFDQNGNNVETSYYSMGKIKSQERKMYDANGNVIEFVQVDPSNGEQIINRYEYDKLNRKIGEVTLRNLMVTAKVRLKYDSKNNVTDSLTYSMLGNVVLHEKHVYEYDAEGNWAKQTILTNNKPTSVILHQIEYY